MVRQSGTPLGTSVNTVDAVVRLVDVVGGPPRNVDTLYPFAPVGGIPGA